MFSGGHCRRRRQAGSTSAVSARFPYFPKIALWCALCAVASSIAVSLLLTLLLGFCVMTGIDLDPEGYSALGVALYAVVQMVLLAAMLASFHFFLPEL